MPEKTRTFRCTGPVAVIATARRPRIGTVHAQLTLSSPRTVLHLTFTRADDVFAFADAVVHLQDMVLGLLSHNGPPMVDAHLTLSDLSTMLPGRGP